MATIDTTEARSIAEAKETQYGLPAGTLFKIAGIESSFNGNAVSPKGAKGYFQFIDSTAKAYGLDDPTDFEKSADAAGRYLSDNLKRYNGNINLAIAEYNGGGKAAAALAKGKPWPETVDYLNKFHGGKQDLTTTPKNSLSPQFSTGEEIAPTASPSASEVYKATVQNEAENGGFINGVANLPEAFAKGWTLDNSVWNYYQTTQIEKMDPNFAWNEENLKSTMDGVPQRYWDYVLEAKSQQEADDRKARVSESLGKEQRLAEMGVSGFAGRMVGGLVDLPTLIAFIPYLGGGSALTVTSRLANAARLGLIGAGTNVAFDAAAMPYRPLATEDDLYISGLMGLSLGALAGGSINPKSIARMRLAEENKALGDVARKAMIREQEQEIIRNGFDLTKEGRAYFDNLKASTEARNTFVMDKAPGSFKYDPQKEYVLRGGLLEEVKTPVPLYEKGYVPHPLYGAESNVSNFFASRTANGAELDLEKVLKNFTFNSKGEITGVNGARATKADFDIVGVKTREDVKGALEKYKQEASFQKLVQFSRKESSKTNLDKLAQSSDPTIARLAERLKEQLMSDVPVYRVRQKDIDSTFGGTKGKYGGFYSSARHAVFVPDNASEGTMLHEILHAATVHKLDYGIANPNTVHGKLVGELDALYKKALEEAKAKGFKSYYLTNIKEFTAGLYTGKQAKAFHDFLTGIKDVDGTMMSKIIDVIRNMFGFGEDETNALVKALDLTDRLNDEKLTVSMDRQGNLGKDTIYFQAAEGVDPELAVAASRANLAPVFGWGLGLEHKLGSARVPQAVRDLASKLFGTTVGYKDHAVVKANAWDDTIKMADSWAVEMRKGTYPHFEDWMKTSGYKWHEKGKAFDDFGAKVSNYIRGMDGDYPPQVMKAGDQMRKTLAKIVDYINNPGFDQGMIKRGLTEVEIQDVKTGLTELVGKLEKNPNYLPRKHDVNKWNSLVSTHGRDSVEGWWARAYKSARGDAVTDDQAARFGKWYVRSVEEAHANRTTDLFDDLLKGQDRDALKFSLMQNGGFNEQQAVDIIEGMFPTRPSDIGRTSSSLRHRNTIDEGYVETWRMPDGTTQEVTLNDFIHSNAFEVVEPYIRRTAASVALAKHLDVYKMSDIDKLIADATQNKLGSEFVSNAEIAKTREHLQFTFDRILGIPEEEFTKLNKGLSMWRNFNVIRLMGAAVWNQAIEFSQTVGTMGWKATLQALPELRALRRDLASGKAPNDLLDHLENTIGGVGSEYIARLEFKGSDDWVRNLGDSKFNQRLDQLDTGLKKMARGVLDYTGMTPLMIQQKRIHAIALVNHFVNQANGKIQSKFLTKDRLAWMGLSERDTAKIMENLKKYTKEANGQFAKTHKLDLDKWVKEDPESHSKFMTAIHRESRRVVQENDLASMVPIMGTTLGKTVFQFMNFTIHGWNKSLNFALNHRDYSTMATMLHGSFMASLAYMGRTTVQSAGMDTEKKREFLEKRFSTGQIVANSFGRLAQVSLLPNIYDTLSPYPMFQGMRTTSDLSSLASNPTYQAVNTLISMKKAVRNATSDEYQTTSKDIKAWSKLLPLQNIYPMTTILNSLANDYPTSEQQD